MKAKKHLGQHFLRSKKALSQIIAAANPDANDIVLEIGPGEGVLTEKLVQCVGTVIAVEKDRELIPVLQEKFAAEVASGKLELIHADILTFELNPSVFGQGSRQRYKLIANIPYYITGAIIEKFLSTPYQPEKMVLLMQKEVAERIVAKDGKESILSIAVSAYGIPRIVGKVPPGAFAPAPTVDSAILEIGGISRDFFIDCDETHFFQLVKAVFGKKRKQIGGSLGEFIGDKTKALDILNISTIAPTTRPETMTLTQWKVLTRVYTGVINGVQYPL